MLFYICVLLFTSNQTIQFVICDRNWSWLLIYVDSGLDISVTKLDVFQILKNALFRIHYIDSVYHRALYVLSIFRIILICIHIILWIIILRLILVFYCLWWFVITDWRHHTFVSPCFWHKPRLYWSLTVPYGLCLI